MRIVFMGTPDFAEGVLRSLCESRHEIVAVITQPDKPKGRSDKMIPSPVKVYATEQGIEVYQPERIKRPECVSRLREYEADIFVVAAFGQILSKEILDMPKWGCVNIHASLLPKYRGAAPIQWAIADGRSETGVTIQQMNEGVDTGDILSSQVVAIADDETGGSLFDKLMEAGAKLIISTLDEIEAGTVTRTVQDESKATHAKMLTKEMGRIDYNMSAREIDCRIRAFTPWPGGYTYLDGKMIKIKACKPIDTSYDGANGQVAEVTKDAIIVKCAKGALAITALQPEGKKAMSTHDYLLGKSVSVGDRFE